RPDGRPLRGQRVPAAAEDVEAATQCGTGGVRQWGGEAGKQADAVGFRVDGENLSSAVHAVGSARDQQPLADGRDSRVPQGCGSVTTSRAAAPGRNASTERSGVVMV